MKTACPLCRPDLWDAGLTVPKPVFCPRHAHSQLAEYFIQTFGLNPGTGKPVEDQMTIPEIAAVLRTDETTVWRWIRTQKLAPVRKLGTRITRVPARAVREFLENRTV